LGLLREPDLARDENDHPNLRLNHTWSLAGVPGVDKGGKY
jgi:hypothetical protein